MAGGTVSREVLAHAAREARAGAPAATAAMRAAPAASLGPTDTCVEGDTAPRQPPPAPAPSAPDLSAAQRADQPTECARGGLIICPRLLSPVPSPDDAAATTSGSPHVRLRAGR